MDTVRVRIAVAVDAEGNWSCAGWNPEEREDKAYHMMRVIASDTLEPTGAEAYHWVEADVPVPVETTVVGEVN